MNNKRSLNDKAEFLEDFFAAQHIVMAVNIKNGHFFAYDDEGNTWKDSEIYDFAINECLAFNNDGTLSSGLGAAEPYYRQLIADAKDFGVIPNDVWAYESEKIITDIVNSRGKDDKLEAFVKTLFEEIDSDSESYEKIGYFLLKGVLKDNSDDIFISLCGWSIKSLLEKAHILPDIARKFYDKPIKTEFITALENDKEISCSCFINPQTFEVYEFGTNDINDFLANEESVGHYVVIDGLRFSALHKEFLSKNDKCTYWYN